MFRIAGHTPEQRVPENIEECIREALEQGVDLSPRRLEQPVGGSEQSYDTSLFGDVDCTSSTQLVSRDTTP